MVVCWDSDTPPKVFTEASMILFLFEKEYGPCGIRDRETDWLTLENALNGAPSPRRRIER